MDKQAQQMILIRGPRVGRMLAVSASTVAATLNISDAAWDGYTIEVHAQGGDVFVAIGPTQASLASISATATSSTLGNATVTARIPQDQSKRWRLGPNDNFLGYVTASGSATVRVEFNSDPGDDRMTRKVP